MLVVTFFSRSNIVYLRSVKMLLKNIFPRKLSLRKCSSRVSLLRKAIVDETEVVTCGLTPEMSLRLITENCRLFNATSEILSTLPFKDPFWGFYWPGGMSVTRYILDHPEIVKNKNVLDFGSGCGATAIACMMRQCSRAIANDIDEAAAVAARINAELNCVEIETDTRNLINDPITDIDVIVLGDVFYDEDFAALLLPWIQRLVADGKLCLIGDPGRHALSKQLNLKLLASYNLPERTCIENHGFKTTSVFKVL